MTRWIVRVGATALVAATATNASASPLLFSYAGTDSSGSAQNLSFTLDSNPTPYFFDQHVTDFSPVSATFQGSSTPNNFLIFGTGGYGGGFEFDPGSANDFSVFQRQLFSGPTSSPVFSPGTFQLLGGYASNGGTLTISAPGASGAPGAPGPEVGIGWMSALVSFGALAATRLRRRVTA